MEKIKQLFSLTDKQDYALLPKDQIREDRQAISALIKEYEVTPDHIESENSKEIILSHKDYPYQVKITVSDNPQSFVNQHYQVARINNF